MEALARDRYRPLTAVPCAAAYVDGEGTIFSSNEMFDALRQDVPGGPPDGNGFPVLFVPEDREQVRELLAGAGSRARRTLRAGADAASAVKLAVEFIPIRRRVRTGIVWLVTLRPVETAVRITPELATKAALTERYVDDLRGPVQDVLGWASLLRRSYDEPERIEQALATIERNAEVLMNLLRNFLEQTRPPGIDRGAGDVESSRVA
jgi:signal transduction histidine kinase